MSNDFLQREEEIVKMLRTVYDPEIPVNVYDLGLIYGVEVSDDGAVKILMTLTALVVRLQILYWKMSVSKQSL
ncbi:hypothetical protein HMPREF1869_00812 [Bacteroidales bacterium KA00251]|nr:hypothetical protein HMPREF1869_00812 [Bacteroidales bacterium KA00251]